MSYEEYKASPWFTARVGDKLWWYPVGGLGAFSVVITSRTEDAFRTDKWSDSEHLHYKDIMPGWQYDEITLAKKIIQSYEV